MFTWPFVRRATYEAAQARYIGASSRLERVHQSYLALLDENARRREVNDVLAEANTALAQKVADLRRQIEALAADCISLQKQRQPRDSKTGRMLPRANGHA